jgi:Tol biopolymer transport system component
MTSPRRFEADLPALLGDLYLAGTPVYRDDLVQQVARTQQRPAWTFPGRWLPMELVTTRVPATRLPMRQLGVLALIAILLVAALAAYVGSQQTRLPEPFGLAGNGVIAFSKDGDIHTVDLATGISTPVIDGPDADRRPNFSSDGTKFVFLRERADGTDRFDLVVASKDGRGARVLDSEPISLDDTIEWAPDGTYLLHNSATALSRVDAVGSEPPRVLARDVHIFAGAFRPPDGAQILYEVDTSTSTALFVMDADGSHQTKILERPAAGQVGAISQNVRWSPDGRMIALGIVGPLADGNVRIHVMNADGSDLHPAGDATGIWVENDVVWSPDSTHVAFNRWRPDAAGGWEIRPVGIVPARGGAIREVGAIPAPDGVILEFSPDGTTILAVSGPFVGAPTDGGGERPMIIDVASGRSTQPDWEVASGTSWQRVAP